MENISQEQLAKYFVIPQRYITAILCGLALCTSYALRSLLAIAITEMVRHPNKTSNVTDGDVCPGGVQLNTVVNPRLLYEWDETTQGLILSSFYWGYIVSHLPAGILAERFGGKYALGLGVLGSSLLDIATPLCIHLSGGSWKVLVSVKVINGLCQGTVLPAVTAMHAQWIPSREKNTIIAVSYTTAFVGGVFSTLGGGRIIKDTQVWSPIFYLFGGIGILWFIFWQLLGYSNPDTNPFIGEKEKQYLHQQLEAHVSHNVKFIPWGAIFSSVPVWTLIIAQLCFDLGWYILATELPKYMKDVLKLKIEDNAFWSSIPVFSMWLMSLIFGFLADCLINREYLSTTSVRKIFATVGFVGSACFLLIASYAGCNKNIAVTAFTTAFSLLSAYYPGVKINALDLSPNYAGIIIGLTNGIGVIMGIFAPSLVALITPDRTVHQWRYVYWILFYVYCFASVVFLIFASGDEQYWNNAAQK